MSCKSHSSLILLIRILNWGNYVQNLDNIEENKEGRENVNMHVSCLADSLNVYIELGKICSKLYPTFLLNIP